MIYTTAMGYSIPAVNIKETVLNKIQAKALESFVPELGYNRTFTRAVIFGPSKFGGASIPHLNTEDSANRDFNVKRWCQHGFREISHHQLELDPTRYRSL